MTRITVGELARRLSGEVEGDAERVIEGVASVREAGPGDLTYVSDARYGERLAGSRPGAVLLPADLELPGVEAPFIRVDDPERAFARAVPVLVPGDDRREGVHSTAFVSEDAELGGGVTVGAFGVVEADAIVGRGTRIGPQAVVAAGARVGSECRVGPGTTVHGCARLGDRVVLGSGVRVGAEGYGYVEDEEGRPERVPHVGGCVIGDDVEIGANSTVDRGSVDDTVIGAHTKIDNLVHVGHNVRIGRGCLIVAQVGLAGSARIGDGVRIGGQAGIAGHLEVADGARVAAQAGVIGDVPAGAEYSGYPARPHREALRASALQLRLPELVERVRRLEERLEEQGGGEEET